MVFGRRYRVTEHIGAGGMADVYKAVDETLGRTVAVKVLHQRLADDPDFVQRFRHEASAAANLSHPGIVNIYDYGVENGTYYIVMELVRGTDLKAVVKQDGPIDPIKVAEYGAQVCSALSVAHGYGLIHRDIKPQNIVLTPDGTLKVMDFGIVRAIDSDSTQTGSVLGTAQYVSPEQAQGRKLGPESDLYSLGVVLYELATGRPPFEGDTPVAVALKHVNDEPIPPRKANPQIPPALEAIIIKAMQKDPTHRYRSAEEMREDLLRVVAGRAVAAQPRVDDTTVMPYVQASSQPDVRRVPERRRMSGWAWAGIIALIVLLGLGVAFAALGGAGLSWLSGFTTSATVPITQGLTLDAATAKITEAGLVVGNVDTRPDPLVPKGDVISTEPTQGASATRGDKVNIVLSSGPEMVTVPSVIGSNEATAILELENAGFSVDPMITRDFNSKYPAGQVYQMDPAADAQVAKGAKIHLWVSQGPQMIVVPSVAGQSQSDATLALVGAGFKVKVVQKSDGTVAKGTVISQKPAGTAQAAKGSTVTIYVSTGPAQVVVPNLVGLTQAEAVAKIQALKLVESVQTLIDADPTHTGLVQNQDPAANTKVNQGSTVTIWVAVLSGP
jgi:beta-lactam-binding protein with PASTA domain/tRNA A-37 threonylcarbamoyl transferase component Bud32